MARITIYASAFIAAFMVFAATGGIRASEHVVKVEERGGVSAFVPAGANATIPFPDGGNIRDWRPDGTDALYVQDRRAHWYRATLTSPCVDLPGANRIAFLTQGANRLDEFSAISVRGQRCQFSALVTSAAPPKREKGTAVKTEPSKG